MRRTILFPLVSLALAACGGTVTKEKIEHINVPVIQPCVTGPEVAKTPPLNSQYSDEEWKALTPKQKAAIVAGQGLKHQNEATLIRANSSSCPHT